MARRPLKRRALATFCGLMVAMSGTVPPVHAKPKGDSFPIQLSKWRLTGEMSTLASRVMPDNRKAITTLVNSSRFNLEKKGRGILWNPKVGTWTGGIQAGFVSTSQRVKNETTRTSEESLSRTVSGDLNVDMLPKTRYPFRFIASRMNQDSSEGMSGGRGAMQQRIGFQQDWQSKKPGSRISFRADRNEFFSGNLPGLGVERFPRLDVLTFDTKAVRDLFSLNASTSLGASNRLNFAGSYGVNTVSDAENYTIGRETNLTLNHDLAGKKNWGLANMFNIGRNTMGVRTTVDGIQGAVDQFGVVAVNATNATSTNGTSTNGTASAQSNSGGPTYQFQRSVFNWRQLSSTLSWRGDEAPVTVGVSGRVYETATKSQQMGSVSGFGLSSQSQSINLNASANYQYSPALRLDFRMAGNRNTVRDGEGRTQEAMDGSDSINAQYNPPAIPIGGPNGVIYYWSANGGSGVDYGTDRTPARRASQGLAHSLSKRLDLNNGKMALISLSESGTADQKNDSLPLLGVTHSATLGIDRQSDDGGVIHAEIAGSDSRRYVREESENQMLNLQLSNNGPFGPGELSGHATLQWNRRVVRAIEEEEPRSLNGLLGGGNTTPGTGGDNTTLGATNPFAPPPPDPRQSQTTRSSTVTLGYRQRDLFDLSNLNYRAQATMNASGLMPVSKKNETETRVFSHSLSYGIGRVSAQMTMGVTEIRTRDHGGQVDGYILFEMKRFIEKTF